MDSHHRRWCRRTQGKQSHVIHFAASSCANNHSQVGKAYGRNQADEMQNEYRDATTRKDIAQAIEEYNHGLPEDDPKTAKQS